MNKKDHQEIVASIKKINAEMDKCFDVIEEYKAQLPYPVLAQTPTIKYPTGTPLQSSISEPNVGIYGTVYDTPKKPLFKAK